MDHHSPSQAKPPNPVAMDSLCHSALYPWRVPGGHRFSTPPKGGKSQKNAIALLRFHPREPYGIVPSGRFQAIHARPNFQFLKSAPARAIAAEPGTGSSWPMFNSRRPVVPRRGRAVSTSPTPQLAAAPRLKAVSKSIFVPVCVATMPPSTYACTAANPSKGGKGRAASTPSEHATMASPPLSPASFSPAVITSPTLE
eukprot:Hpha_TRINITY_DN7382_c0_g1::TRINITY_DN7382_c0_g1_i1::g.10048::m.10048